MKVYVIGSLRNPRITEVGNALRKAGHEAFEDWHSGGPEADDEWQRYERERGRGYKEALRGHHALNIFHFDLYHLNESDAAVLVMPAGRSAHLELGYMVGRKKHTYVLFDAEPERFDIMYNLCQEVFFNLDELLDALNKLREQYPGLRTVDHAPWNA